jgi:hypothetical protein
MAKNDLPSPELLRKLLRYEPETGKLFWLARGKHPCASWDSRFEGKEAFTCVGNHGYRHGAVLGKSITAHRVVWAIYYGEWPPFVIDHKDGDRLNNKIANLRSATRSQNNANSKPREGGYSKYKGVTWHKLRNKWMAQIRNGPRKIHLGYFECEKQAYEAYCSAAAQEFGEFARGR